jgi:hypothetical protein
LIWLCNHETSARVKLSPFSGRPAYAARAPDSSVELANAVAGDERLVDQHAQYRPRKRTGLSRSWTSTCPLPDLITPPFGWEALVSAKQNCIGDIHSLDFYRKKHVAK